MERNEFVRDLLTHIHVSANGIDFAKTCN
jgi:hypothetical protein